MWYTNFPGRVRTGVIPYSEHIAILAILNIVAILQETYIFKG